MKSEEQIRDALVNLCDVPCWYVGTGGAVGTSFTLHFGAKIPRERPLKNPAVTDDFRCYEGEHILLVWCSWRLDGPLDILASSDSSCATASQTLQEQLTSRKLVSATAFNRAFDVALEFEGELQLRIFCDRFAGNGESGMNWQLETGRHIIVVGPGYRTSIDAQSRAGKLTERRSR
jgi:hypothetical protein